MKLAIMQPYFFPYLGYFSLIKHTDKFISFDPVQYIRKGWINRNRILKPNEGWQYIIAPVQSNKQNDLIKDTKVVEGDEWKIKVIKQLDHYKKRAPYYTEVISLLEDCFQNNDESIARLNTYYLDKVCQYLQIPFKAEIYSEMGIDVSANVNAPDEWALRISEALGAKEYVNPPGGKEFFDKAKYDQSNIELRFLEINLENYSQKRPSFEPGLSIIDVMMFNSIEQINKMLDNYKLT
jgi:hypothetical protein